MAHAIAVLQLTLAGHIDEKVSIKNVYSWKDLQKRAPLMLKKLSNWRSEGRYRVLKKITCVTPGCVDQPQIDDSNFKSLLQGDVLSFLYKVAPVPDPHEQTADWGSASSRAGTLYENQRNRDDSNVHHEKRRDHEDWFEGIESNNHFETKSAYMKHVAVNRLLNYVKHVLKDGIKKHNKMIQKVSNRWKNKIRYESYGDYFARRSQSKRRKKRSNSRRRLCDRDGLFECQGQYGQEQCQHEHRINPYASKQERAYFQCTITGRSKDGWSVDHQIEQRAVRDVIKKIVADRRVKLRTDVRWNELFHLTCGSRPVVTSNLKLVENRCHEQDQREDLDIQQFLKASF